MNAPLFSYHDLPFIHCHLKTSMGKMCLTFLFFLCFVHLGTAWDNFSSRAPYCSRLVPQISVDLYGYHLYTKRNYSVGVNRLSAFLLKGCTPIVRYQGWGSTNHLFLLFHFYGNYRILMEVKSSGPVRRGKVKRNWVCGPYPLFNSSLTL